MEKEAAAAPRSRGHANLIVRECQIAGLERAMDGSAADAGRIRKRAYRPASDRWRGCEQRAQARRRLQGHCRPSSTAWRVVMKNRGAAGLKASLPESDGMRADTESPRDFSRRVSIGR